MPNEVRVALRNAYESFSEAGLSADQTLGVYLELKGIPGRPLPDVEWEGQGIRLGAVKDDGQRQSGALYVPKVATDYFLSKVDAYSTHDFSGAKAPKGYDKLGGVDSVLQATLSSLWTDRRAIHRGLERTWWECWCWTVLVPELRLAASALSLRVSDRELNFPDVTVVPVFANEPEMLKIVGMSRGAIEELRFANDHPHFFAKLTGSEQELWMGDLVARTHVVPNPSAVVCLLDTGVNRAHPLISRSLPIESCLSVVPSWGVDDHSNFGHGTAMAGLALHGDLTQPLQSTMPRVVGHGLESITFVPPSSFSATEPQNYGAVTQSAVALAEITSPEKNRVLCMAVTNQDVSGEVPSSWSAAIDQLCAGVPIGDEATISAEWQDRRLFLVSTGNVPDYADPSDAEDPDEFPIEDPCQAWNAIGVGAMTDLVTVHGSGLIGWTPVADVGERSPYSRASTDWTHNRSPIKPEVVFEGGNRALAPDGSSWDSGIDSLSLLSTSKDFIRRPLETFWATSASTAQASRFAAQVMTDAPDLWPETVRALMVHSAQWTPAMRGALDSCASASERMKLVRQFGYGIPSISRALRSAAHDVAMISEKSIQPFECTVSNGRRGRVSYSNPRFNELHMYRLPWPQRTLEQMQGDIRLRITLSYFVQPNPTQGAAVAPAWYQSFGLRFQLKRRRETADDFISYISGQASADDVQRESDDGRWLFGPRNISAGSLHCDEWVGPASELAARNMVAVYPVAGWWKFRKSLGMGNAQGRYALIMSLESIDQSVDLLTEIQTAATISSMIEI